VPRHAGALDALESVLAERGDQTGLIEVLQLKVEAAAKRPTIQRVLLARLGDALASLGPRRGGARRVHRSAGAGNADYLPALRFLARESLQAGEPERAEVYYRRLVATLNRTAVEARDAEHGCCSSKANLRLAELARGRRQLAEEEGHLEMALAVDPRCAEALAHLDTAARSAGGARVELAEVLRRRIALAPDLEATVGSSCGAPRFYESLPGRRNDAATAYRQVLLLAPAHDGALARLAELLRETRATPELVDVLECRAEIAECAGQRGGGRRPVVRGRPPGGNCG